MITIHHNFDETKFKWLWAKYVRAGNIEKHCTASLIGPYSKKFSGSTNKNLLSQPVLVMDEIPETSYEAIYFCGVLKQGYLSKNPLKNNYQHNVHLAVRPVEGGHDIWDFENWHVEIEGGVVERIPATYELSEKFFHTPYTSHYYTCRIFRWMVGHFYPNELQDLSLNLPEIIQVECYPKDAFFPTKNIIEAFIKHGYECAEYYFMEAGGDSNACPWEELSKESEKVDIELKRKHVLIRGEFNRNIFFESCQVHDWMMFDTDKKVIDVDGIEREVNLSTVYDVTPIDYVMANRLYDIGMNEFLDMVAPYQKRDIVKLNDVTSK